MRFIWIPILAAVASLGYTNAPPLQNTMEFLFKCTGRTCVIRENLGGIPFLFALAAAEVRQKDIKVRIEGKCSSACVIFASIARKNVCVTKDARMGIHQGREDTLLDPSGNKVDLGKEGNAVLYFNPPPGYKVETTFYIPNYGKDINEWALRENKMPGSTDVYVMTREEALRFWKPCR